MTSHISPRFCFSMFGTGHLPVGFPVCCHHPVTRTGFLPKNRQVAGFPDMMLFSSVASHVLTSSLERTAAPLFRFVALDLLISFLAVVSASRRLSLSSVVRRRFDLGHCRRVSFDQMMSMPLTEFLAVDVLVSSRLAAYFGGRYGFPFTRCRRTSALQRRSL